MYLNEFVTIHEKSSSLNDIIPYKHPFHYSLKALTDNGLLAWEIW